MADAEAGPRLRWALEEFMRTRHLVDPELLPLLEAFPPLVIDAETLPAVRARVLPYPDDPEAEAKVAVETLLAPGPAGAPEVGIVFLRPRAATGPLPCILHIHGGGYVAGSAANSTAPNRTMAAKLGCTIASVEYRLAPEAPFPAAIEDCYAALGWLVANAGSLNIDASRIGVMGESAGGGLAAALALMARDRGQYKLAFQHLIYPMIDDRTCVEGDPHPHTGEFIWTRASNLFGWRSLLGGQAPGGANVSAYAAAARATDVSGLPPTFVATAALDLFVDENLEYARRLMRAGVAVEMHSYAGAFHGFQLAASARVAQAAARDSLGALSRALFG
jgi:triacylglycerol lipase